MKPGERVKHTAISPNRATDYANMCAELHLSSKSNPVANRSL